MEEIWKPVVGYEGLYEVSSLGRIKSLWYKNQYISVRRDKILNHRRNNRTWYLYVILCIKSLKKTFPIHRLVWLAFLENRKYCINHKNWIKTDNRVENLEWCTSSENHLHRFKALWHKTSQKTIEAAKRNRLLIKNERITFQYSISWQFIKEFPMIISASRELWISRQSISRCCRWLGKTAWWFIWKYKDN